MDPTLHVRLVSLQIMAGQATHQSAQRLDPWKLVLDASPTVKAVMILLAVAGVTITRQLDPISMALRVAAVTGRRGVPPGKRIFRLLPVIELPAFPTAGIVAASTVGREAPFVNVTMAPFVEE